MGIGVAAQGFMFWFGLALVLGIVLPFLKKLVPLVIQGQIWMLEWPSVTKWFVLIAGLLLIVTSTLLQVF